MALPIIVLGSGGHAKVVLDVLRLLEKNVIGLTTQDQNMFDRTLLGYRVLGDDTALARYAPSAVRLVNAVGSVQSMDERKILFEKFKALGYGFEQVIHPMAVVARDAVLDEGVHAMAGVVIQPGSHIGDNTIINTRASVDHDCEIGRHVHIAPGCTLSANVTVGDETHVGTGATIIQGLRIGRRCLVAAGAVVCRDVDDLGWVAGVPARRMRGDA
ncbi:MAG: acetyltransferase [Betaproteobacteria bacterium]|nr:acetyltransferase [Betaproteobacteria bacterium]